MKHLPKPPLSQMRALLLAFVLPLAAQAQSEPATPNFFGLLPVRDMTPFGFRRLEMRPAPAETGSPGRVSAEVSLGYQNTWTMSEGVEAYLQGRERAPLSAADVAAIRALPGDQYLVDLEMALLDVSLRLPISKRLEAFALLSSVRTSGGFMDGMIEGFHRRLGLGNAARETVSRNRFNMLMDLKGVQIEDIESAAPRGALDPLLGIRYQIPSSSKSLRWIAEAAVKLPVGNESRTSTGRADLGAQLTAQYFRERDAFYASAMLVYFAGSPAPYRNASSVVPTAILGYEVRATPQTNLLAQLYLSRGAFTSRETDLKELRGMKVQLSLGLRHRLEGMHLTASLTENLVKFNNTPDIGLQLGLGFDL